MSSERRGSLYLLPNTLGDAAPDAVIPSAVLNRARTLDYIIAEDPKAARAFLKRIAAARSLQGIRVERLDHNTKAGDIPALLEPLLAGSDAVRSPSADRGVRRGGPDVGFGNGAIPNGRRVPQKPAAAQGTAYGIPVFGLSFNAP